MAVKQRHMTLEEFLELPEEEPALEFEDGVVTQKVPPQGKHGVLQFAICDLINQLARPSKVAMAIPELRTTYTGRSYVPDVAVYRWGRIPKDSSGEIANSFREPPDIAVEIVSPEQSVNYLVLKCNWYVDHGVQAALVVDPSHKSILVFRPGQRPIGLYRSDQIDLSDIIPGLTLSVSDIFDALLI